MWRMLFQMVEGGDLDSLLLELVECIPWDSLSATSDGDRQWFALSTTSPQIANSSVHQMRSSSVLQQTMSPTPSSRPPQAQEGAQTNMDMSPDSVQTHNQPIPPTAPTPSSLPQADGEEPMDTRPDGEDDLTANNRPVPDKVDTRRGEQDGDKSGSGYGDGVEDEQDTRRGEQDGDKSGSGDGVEDEQEQGINEETPPTGSAAVGISPLKKTHPKIALKKKRPRRAAKMDDKNYMPSSEVLGETDLGRLLAAGESYNMAIDVEAVDMLMRNFPITEEHQVRSVVDYLKSFIIV